MDNQKTLNRPLLEEVVDDLIIRMDIIENREVKLPDYSKPFESLENLIKNVIPDYNKPLGFQ